MTTALADPAPEATSNGTPGGTSAQRLDHVGIAAELFARGKFPETLRTAVGLAQHTFGCDAAGVILIADGSSYVGAAASTVDADAADGLQIEHYEGPGLDAITGLQPVVAADLRLDSRWRLWAPQAAELGFRSVLSLVLTDSDPLGSLTLYSRRPSFFGDGLVASGQVLAQQVSIAIAIGVEREQLARARDSHEVVGQATGILMERYRVPADEAIAMLRRYSSHSNQKLRLLAERVITDRALPELIVRDRGKSPTTSA
jgi:ANTAR domain-containing protein/GAF domain-containing protein